MARKIAIVLAIAVLATLAVTIGCSGSKNIIVAPQRTPGSMNGVVTSIVGDTPVTNASIHVISTPFIDGNSAEAVSVFTTTDNQGRYNIDIAYGKVVVVVTKDEFKRPDPKMWSLSPGGNGRLDFVLVPGTNSDQIDPRVHDQFCLMCHYNIQIPDPNSDGRKAWPPKGTSKGGGPAKP